MKGTKQTGKKISRMGAIIAEIVMLQRWRMHFWTADTIRIARPVQSRWSKCCPHVLNISSSRLLAEALTLSAYSLEYPYGSPTHHHRS